MAIPGQGIDETAEDSAASSRQVAQAVVSNVVANAEALRNAEESARAEAAAATAPKATEREARAPVLDKTYAQVVQATPRPSSVSRYQLATGQQDMSAVQITDSSKAAAIEIEAPSDRDAAQAVKKCVVAPEESDASVSKADGPGSQREDDEQMQSESVLVQDVQANAIANQMGRCAMDETQAQISVDKLLAMNMQQQDKINALMDSVMDLTKQVAAAQVSSNPTPPTSRSVVRIIDVKLPEFHGHEDANTTHIDKSFFLPLIRWIREFSSKATLQCMLPDCQGKIAAQL